MLGGVIFFVLGVLFLLRDLNVWGFWNIQWYSAAFLVWGFLSCGMCKCPECNAAMGTPMKKR